MKQQHPLMGDTGYREPIMRNDIAYWATREEAQFALDCLIAHSHMPVGAVLRQYPIGWAVCVSSGRHIAGCRLIGDAAEVVL